MNERLASVRARMAETGTELVVLGPGANQKWLLGFHTFADERPCYLLVGPLGEAFVMPLLNADEARSKSDIPMEVWADADGPHAALVRGLAAVGAADARSIALDESMRTDYAFLIAQALPAARTQMSSDSIMLPRMRKSASELGFLRENAAIADAAVRAAAAALRPGGTEADAARTAAATFTSHGADVNFTMLASAGNGALPHYVFGERVLGEGDVVVIDLGGRRDGYCSDITRMACIGTPGDAFLGVHAIVERAVQAALAAARPGVKASTVDLAARQVIADAGYGDRFLHRTGHGIGTEGHEQPFITGSSQTLLEEGMVFSIEPGIYLPGRFGVRLEEIVHLGPKGPEILSALPRDIIRI